MLPENSKSNDLRGNKETNKLKNGKKVRDIASTLREEGYGKIPSDVTGSYVGLSYDGDNPIQDADDL